MKEKNYNTKKFIDKCMELVPEFFQSLQKSKYSRNDVDFFKENLILFLKEFAIRSKEMQFNADFINVYLSKLIFEKYPEYSKTKIIKIQTLIKEFINFLTLKDVFEKKVSQRIYRKLFNKTELKREINKTLNLKNLDESNEITNKLITAVNNINKYENRNIVYPEKYYELIDYFKNKKDETIVKAIFNLIKVIENDSLFFNLITIVSNTLKNRILPTRIIKYLRNHPQQNRMFNRLLMLYLTFNNSDSHLKTSFSDLCKELGVDINSFFRYMVKTIDYLDKNDFIEI